MTDDLTEHERLLLFTAVCHFAMLQWNSFSVEQKKELLALSTRSSDLIKGTAKLPTAESAAIVLKFARMFGPES